MKNINTANKYAAMNILRAYISIDFGSIAASLSRNWRHLLCGVARAGVPYLSGLAAVYTSVSEFAGAT